jgi:hypothetical protein
MYKFRNVTPLVVVPPDPTCNPVVAESVIATFSTTTFGFSTVTAPMSGTDGAYRRTPNPRTTLDAELIRNACTKSLARTDFPAGSVPNHNVFADSSKKNDPAPTNDNDFTCRCATPATHT